MFIHIPISQTADEETQHESTSLRRCYLTLCLSVRASNNDRRWYSAAAPVADDTGDVRVVTVDKGLAVPGGVVRPAALFAVLTPVVVHVLESTMLPQTKVNP